jgi:hypothetical protein
MNGKQADIRRCQHIKANGTQCGSPALRKEGHCVSTFATRGRSGWWSAGRTAGHADGVGKGLTWRRVWGVSVNEMLPQLTRRHGDWLMMGCHETPADTAHSPMV